MNVFIINLNALCYTQVKGESRESRICQWFLLITPGVKVSHQRTQQVHYVAGKHWERVHYGNDVIENIKF